MTPPLVFSLAGTPRAQPRPRFVKGRVVSTVSPKAKLWRGALARVIREAVANRGDAVPLFTGAVRVTMVFSFAPPASARERIGSPHTHKPDAENLAKMVLDVMTECGVYRDDSQVSSAPPEKWWAARAGLSVKVECMAGERRDDALAWKGETPDWLTLG